MNSGADPLTPASEEDGGGAVVVRSPAKINWTLCILGRRADGYHELESLVSPVSLYDELRFTRRREPGVNLVCDTAGVPLDERNLIVKAALLLARAGSICNGADCRLLKRIPVGGGLGGGSSNAASTLTALNRLWDLHWPMDRLATLAAQLGSDVPLFLHAGSVIMRGRGERIKPVTLGWNGWVVLVFPGVPVSTAEVYQAWRPGETPAADLSRFATAPSGAAEWMEWTFNMLEAPAMEVCPALRELLGRLMPLAGRPVRVSGSGSTLFTAFDGPGEAERFAAVVTRETKLEARVVQPIARVEARTA